MEEPGIEHDQPLKRVSDYQTSSSSSSSDENDENAHVDEISASFYQNDVEMNHQHVLVNP
jgi:hypothetical protein